jgi:lipid-binding SYLF domain-containing protein
VNTDHSIASVISSLASSTSGSLLTEQKHSHNGSWSAPAFLTITGGDWGAQIGVEGIDLVMCFMTEEGARHLLSNKFEIGGEVSAAAGPLGRHASAGTDWKINTQILTYSRAKGAFAGITIGGSYIEPDRDSNVALYGRDVTTTALLTGKIRPPASSETFLSAIGGAKIEAKRTKENK